MHVVDVADELERYPRTGLAITAVISNYSNKAVYRQPSVTGLRERIRMLDELVLQRHIGCRSILREGSHRANSTAIGRTRGRSIAVEDRTYVAPSITPIGLSLLPVMYSSDW